MGSANSTLAKRRERKRSFESPNQLPLTTGALERPLGVQEALFDRRLIPKRKRKWLETDFSWEQCSPNIGLSQDDPTVFRRFPVAQRTDMARGRLPMEHGLYLWKYTWPTNQRGTHAVIGVCTEEQPNSVSGYTHLLGSTKFSWGWDLSKRGLYHGGKRSNYDYPYQTSCHQDVMPEVVVMIVDMDAGTLAFEVDSRYQGIAFTGLKGCKLYAAASAVWGNCDVGLKYLGSYAPGEVKPLVALSRNVVRQAMGARRLADGCVTQLSVPDVLKLYVQCQLPQQYATRDEDRLDLDNNIAKRVEPVAAAAEAACPADPYDEAEDTREYSAATREHLASDCSRTPSPLQFMKQADVWQPESHAEASSTCVDLSDSHLPVQLVVGGQGDPKHEPIPVAASSATSDPPHIHVHSTPPQETMQTSIKAAFEHQMVLDKHSIDSVDDTLERAVASSAAGTVYPPLVPAHTSSIDRRGRLNSESNRYWSVASNG